MEEEGPWAGSGRLRRDSAKVGRAFWKGKSRTCSVPPGMNDCFLFPQVSWSGDSEELVELPCLVRLHICLSLF